MVTLLRPKGDPLRVALTGYRLSEDGNASYIALSVETQPVTANPDPKPVRDEKTGLLDKQSFGEIAEARIREAQATGDDYKLTMLGIGEIEQLRDRIDERTADDLMSDVGEMLREFALDGDLAGQFDDGQFGVIHDASVDVANVKGKISTITREANPSGVGVEVSEASVDIDANALTPRMAPRRYFTRSISSPNAREKILRSAVSVTATSRWSRKLSRKCRVSR